MSDQDLVVATVALGERLGGSYDYDALLWTRVPRTYVSDISEAK